MIRPPIPPDEDERLLALHQLELLDTMPEKDYDNLTRLASEITGMPISLITLVDEKRQWFKSSHGLEVSETPRDHAFCAHAIEFPRQPLIVADATKDERFIGNPLVTGNPHVVFYAGVPILNLDGYPLGTFCVIDNQPNQLSDEQLEALKILANQVSRLFELRWAVIKLKEKEKRLKAKNEELSHLSYIISHDIRSPLNSISSLLEILTDEFGDQLDKDGKKVLELVNGSTTKLHGMVKGMIEYFRNTEKMRLGKSVIDLNITLDKLAQMSDLPPEAKFNFPINLPTIHSTLVVIEQVLLNLITNAIKYNDHPEPEVTFTFSEDEKSYRFEVSDNGRGIPESFKSRLFKLFETGGQIDRFGNQGTGLGLAIIKKLLYEVGGEISVEDAQGGGTKFVFWLPK